MPTLSLDAFGLDATTNPLHPMVDRLAVVAVGHRSGLNMRQTVGAYETKLAVPVENRRLMQRSP
jgi:hypothetical protein